MAHPEAEPMVWAIDEWHSPLYFLPTECPRIAFWPLATTSAEDGSAWFPDDKTRMVIAIEHVWRSRLEEAQVFRYEFPLDTFEDCRDHGVFVSREPVVPTSVSTIGPVLDALGSSSVELRLLPSLVDLAHAVMATSLHWSLIRMRNAAGWKGPMGRPTVPR